MNRIFLTSLSAILSLAIASSAASAMAPIDCKRDFIYREARIMIGPRITSRFGWVRGTMACSQVRKTDNIAEGLALELNRRASVGYNTGVTFGAGFSGLEVRLAAQNDASITAQDVENYLREEGLSETQYGYRCTGQRGGVVKVNHVWLVEEAQDWVGSQCEANGKFSNIRRFSREVPGPVFEAEIETTNWSLMHLQATRFDGTPEDIFADYVRAGEKRLVKERDWAQLASERRPEGVGEDFALEDYLN